MELQNGFELNLTDDTRHILTAYAITEDAQHRDLDGPSTTIPLSEMISSALPPEKKDKLTELNNVSIFLFQRTPIQFH